MGKQELKSFEKIICAVYKGKEIANSINSFYMKRFLSIMVCTTGSNESFNIQCFNLCLHGHWL